MKYKKNPTPKSLFLERMQKLLGKEFKEYIEILKKEPRKSIRCNSLKMPSAELKKRLENKGWKIKELWKDHSEIMIIENKLSPGELGRTLEHLLGYYYVQELASTLPTITLNPKENETILDLCAAPGSKTTQIASKIKNTGTIIANEVSLGRIKILASNLERCGVTNTIITKRDGIAFCNKLEKEDIKFDKILVDAPCSGEGTLRSTPKTYLMWNINTIKRLSKIQKKLIVSAFKLLKPNGELVYSTCTHAPEENEEIIDFLLNEFKDKIKIEKIKLPIKFREGITNWENKKYSTEVKKCARIYPQNADTEGFFIAKIRKLK